MNQEIHWDNIAPTYDDEVFDVFKSDKNKILARYFKKHANKNNIATDFGCGTGKSFPYLAPSFKHIQALDISAECINIARQLEFTNISYKRADLTQSTVKIPPAHFGLCCNVAILPKPEDNLNIIKTVHRGLRKNGSAIFVVPSMESMLFSSWRLMDWYKKEDVSPDKIPVHEFNYFNVDKTDLIQGIIDINGVRTKHYTASELHVLFNEAGLTITNKKKLEYDWSTEFNTPPSWLKAPYPWDWMIECKRLA